MFKGFVPVLLAAFTLSTPLTLHARLPDEDVHKTVDKDIVPVKLVCGVKKSKTGRTWKFCAHEYANTSHNVMYYFHGMNGSERSWRTEGFERKIVKRWVEKGQKPPIVISISFGNMWLMVEKNSSARSGIYEIFRDEVVPVMQNKILRIVPDETWLFGVSMGGFNASQIYFKDPDFFSRAAIICGAMTQVSPFDGRASITAYKKRTGANSLWVDLAMSVSRDYLPTKADWLRESPIIRAIINFSAYSPPLYISDGTADGFGFHEGNILFGWIARLNGAPIEQNFYPKRGHCDVDPNPIADFLMRPMVPLDKPVEVSDLPPLPLLEPPPAQ